MALTSLHASSPWTKKPEKLPQLSHVLLRIWRCLWLFLGAVLCVDFFPLSLLARNLVFLSFNSFSTQESCGMVLKVVPFFSFNYYNWLVLRIFFSWAYNKLFNSFLGYSHFLSVCFPVSVEFWYGKVKQSPWLVKVSLCDFCLLLSFLPGSS